MKKLIALILALLLLGTAALADVVTTGSVNLRTGPGKGYEAFTAVPAGVHLEYLGETVADSRGVDWYHIRCSEGEGWVSSRYAEVVGEAAATAAPAEVGGGEETDAPDDSFDDFAPNAQPESAPQSATWSSVPAGGEGMEIVAWYRTSISAAAAALGTWDYAREENSEIPNRYANDALTLMGGQTVDCILITGPGYTLLGAGTGMDEADARAAFTRAGLQVSDTAEGFSAEYPGENALLQSIGDFGGIIYVTVENGVATSIDLESFTS